MGNEKGEREREGKKEEGQRRGKETSVKISCHSREASRNARE